MAPLVQARGLAKRYHDVVALAGIDFQVEEGECFGLLGPNGAGKTTTLRILIGAAPPTVGELLVAGRDIRRDGRQIKSLLGVVPQEDNLDPDFTALKNLLVYARYFDIPPRVARQRAQEALELVQLWERRQARIETLSGGMKRRLLVARALMNSPKILILDEPTTGLDPQGRHLVWQKLRFLQSQGVTLIISTNNMEEAAALCQRLVVLYQGRILAQGSPAELVSRYGGREVTELRFPPGPRPPLLLAGHQATVEEVADTVYVYSARPLNVDFPGASVVRRSANLEDVFLRLTGRSLRE